MTALPQTRRWTLRRRLGQSFLAIGAVLTVLAAAVAASTVEFVVAGNRVVYRWEPAVATTNRVLTDLVDQVSSVRGYALVRSATALADYRGFLHKQAVDTAALRAHLGTDKQLDALLADLQTAANKWHTTVADPALRAMPAGDPNGLGIVRAAIQQRLFQPVRQRAATLAAAVNHRTKAARQDRRNAGTVFVVAISLTVLVLISMGIALWRGLHRWVLNPVDRLVRQTRQVAGGDTYRQIEPSGPVELAGLGGDVEAMRVQIAGQLARAEETQVELRQRGAELARSNDDLQQFAYVASHDLSEPLRKVANFCQLLERQYGDQLDERAHQYIDYAVDGAKRMQALITDLLALSRVGRTTEEFVAVPLESALDGALANLENRIAAAGGRVERLTELPTVPGDRSLLVSLLENLIGNAIKYQRPDEPPVVRISATHDGEGRMWTLTIADNGIGIEQQYAERIFQVFQRLHLRDSYGGTGIGLALCRKIVEFHGGRIWLEDVQSGAGSTFRFTLPEGADLAESRD